MEIGNKERDDLEKQYKHLIEEKFDFRLNISYIGNKKEPILRLFRFKEAFGKKFVEQMLNVFHATGQDFVFDPFCGMGTTLFTCYLNRTPSLGIDKLPLAVFISKTLLDFIGVNPEDLPREFEKIKENLNEPDETLLSTDIKVFHKAFEKEKLNEIGKWKNAILNLRQPYRDIFMLLFLSILERISDTSKDGQFLRIVKKENKPSIETALNEQLKKAIEDMGSLSSVRLDQSIKPLVIEGDSRELYKISIEKKPNIVITSPPYLNRYDYTRSYSLELGVNFVRNFEELKKLRFSILRSHIESKKNHDDILNNSVILEILNGLEKKELNNPKIPSMITTYFIDMKKSIIQLSDFMAKKSKIAMVVDNVRFEGEHVPVDLILSEFARNQGFRTKKILIGRYKGNSSQQMKKYGRFPVRESILIWER